MNLFFLSLFFTAICSAQSGVNLGTAGNFAILSQSGITDVPYSSITGDIGTSPITGAAITALECPEVNGNIYTVDAAGPSCRIVAPSMLATAVMDMQKAYNDAAGRSNPDYLNFGGATIGGVNLTPGLYRWGSTLVVTTDITLTGSSSDIWIFQVAGTFDLATGARINLSGGARASHIFWQVSGAITLGTTSHLEGIVLGKTSISVNTHASVNGALLAQTAVTLQMNVITKPQSLGSGSSTIQPIVYLGLAKSFAILTKSGVTNVPTSSIIGNVGTSPITGAAITALSCSEVIGNIYTVNAAGPSCRNVDPAMLTVAVLDMQAAYTDAAGRANPDITNLGGGTIGNVNFTPGLYKWTSTLLISNSITLIGGPSDSWIFQVSGTLDLASGAKVILSGGANANNVFWQVTGAISFWDNSHFEGILLAQTSISLSTGASVNGALLAQTAVTLIQNSVHLPISLFVSTQSDISLGTAGNFAILSKSGITNVATSSINGNVGTSPITGAAITGLSCSEVAGNIYTVDAAGPSCRIVAPSMLTTAVLDMQNAYTNAAGRSNPDYLNLGGGTIGSLNLTPGLYRWGSTLVVTTDITLTGSSSDIWIFQVAGTFDLATGVRINLSGGASASHIFWQVSGAVTLGTTSHLEGIVLGKTSISVNTHASVNGALLAQTAVTLQMNSVSKSSLGSVQNTTPSSKKSTKSKLRK